MKIVKTTCSMCSSKCGINVHLDNDKIVKITNMKEHLLNFRCAKSKGIPELLNFDERLTDPLMRKGDSWKVISWDEALGTISEKLSFYKKKYGPESLLIFIGYPWNSSHERSVMERFAHLYGTPNMTNDGSVCYRARIIAGALTFGTSLSVDYSGDIDTKCKVFWGENPDDTWPPHAMATYKFLKRGGKLIVVDPRSISLAKKADIHAQIKPGTDCALALGLLNIIISEGLYDKDFVENWTIGFESLVEHVKDYSPEKVASITNIPVKTIREIAYLYTSNKPGCVHTGIALDHNRNGIQALRAIAILVAITGNLDVPGGNKYSPKLKFKNLRLPEFADEKKAVGAEYSVYSYFTNQTSYLPVIEQLNTGKPYPIKTLLVGGGNPILTWPNANKVIEGFRKIDFKVVIDIFMTETAEMADIILPGSTFLERADLRNYTQHYGDTKLVLTNPVINPIGNAMEDWKIWAALGKKMGFEKFFPWNNNDELVEELLEPMNVSLEELKQNPSGVPYTERRYRQYLSEGFYTPSKKVEIYSERLEKFGYDPLPTFHDYDSSELSLKEAIHYPLRLFSVRKNPNTHSQYRNLPSQLKRLPEPYAEMNPQTALSYEISDRELTKIESKNGFVKMKALLTDDVAPGMIAAPYGWRGEANLNRLTNDKECDPVSGYPTYKSMCQVRVTKA